MDHHKIEWGLFVDDSPTTPSFLSVVTTQSGDCPRVAQMCSTTCGFSGTDKFFFNFVLEQSCSVETGFKKATQKLWALAKVRKCINCLTALVRYKNLILLYLDYCDIVYMHASQLNRNCLQIIQNSACRIIVLADRDHGITEMHRSLNLELLST